MKLITLFTECVLNVWAHTHTHTHISGKQLVGSLCISLSHTHTHTHARTHARTHAHTNFLRHSVVKDWFYKVFFYFIFAGVCVLSRGHGSQTNIIMISSRYVTALGSKAITSKPRKQRLRVLHMHQIPSRFKALFFKGERL